LPASWRGVLKELQAERQAVDAKIDARLKRHARRGDSTKAIAA
jgi:type IV secretory pathway VirD2 relaxase